MDDINLNYFQDPDNNSHQDPNELHHHPAAVGKGGGGEFVTQLMVSPPPPTVAAAAGRDRSASRHPAGNHHWNVGAAANHAVGGGK